MHDGSIKEVNLASVGIVLEDSPWNERNTEVLTITSEVMEDVGVEKPLEVENDVVAVEDIGVEKPIEFENVAAIERNNFKLEPASEASIVLSLNLILLLVMLVLLRTLTFQLMHHSRLCTMEA